MESASGYTVVDDLTPAVFTALAWDFLQREPVRNNVLCTVAQAWVRRNAGPGGARDGQRWLRVLDRDGAVAGAAVLVPTHGTALLSTMPRGAAAAVADHLVAGATLVRGADGPDDASDAFVARWCAATGATRRRGMGQFLFDLVKVAQPEGVPGRPRPATPDDLELVVAWATAFTAEALPDEPPTPEWVLELREWTSQRLAEGTDLWLWDVDWTPVSYCARSRRLEAPGAGTPTAVRISAVYTPPEHRGHGYASANVAALSQLSLDEGADRTLLYTDRSNPTSNKIYQAIGYRLVDTAQTWWFDPPA